MVRLGLRALLGRYPEIQVVGEAATASVALAEIKRLKPDVVLLDVLLPDGGGLSLCRDLQKLPDDLRVLVLTSSGDDETVMQSLAAGADGYLLKEVDSEGLVRAIHQVAAGRSILDPAITRKVLSRPRASGPEVSKDKWQILSAQERRVLALVAEGKTNKEIGFQIGLSDKTVKNYLSNVLEKLQVSRRSQAAAFFAQHNRQPHRRYA